MIFVGQAVEDRDTRGAFELLDRLLGIAAELDRVVHAPQHASGVLHRLLVTDLGACRIEISDMSALIETGDLEGAARACRGLLENQDDLLALQMLLLRTRVLGPLQIASQIEQVKELALREVLNRKERAVAQVKAHFTTSLRQRMLISRQGRATPGRSYNDRRHGRGRARIRAP